MRVPAAMAALFVLIGAALAQAQALSVSNFNDGDTIRYPLPLLIGTLPDVSATEVTLTNRSVPGAKPVTGMAHDGRFKALIELVPGANRLEIVAGAAARAFTLIYQPQTNPHVIRAVYFVDNTGDTRYDTPIPNDAQDYAAKFDVAMKLMQSFTAEWMNHYGYGRQTFNLELDDRGKVIVHVVKGEKSADWYRYDVGGRDNLYGIISHEVGRALPAAPSIDCVLIAFSKLDIKTGKSVAYTALGGGKIALFGGACMYSFPDSVGDIQKAFTNPDTIDMKRYVSDSAGRNTMWGTASTSIGAMMHENGHSMGLPHTVDWRDMMTRGMDHIGRNFVFFDPPSGRNAKPVYFKDDQIGYWSPESAAALAPSVWLDMDATQVKRTSDQTTIALSPDGADIVIASPHGIGFVGYEVPGEARDFVQIDQQNRPREVRLSMKKVRDALGDKKVHLRVMDGDGNMSTMGLREISGEFVRAWRLLDQSVPWDGKQDAPRLTAADLRSLTAKLAGRPLTVSSRARINFERQYPDAKAPSVAYALRTISADAPRPIKLLTGSDDGLRVWLNGKLVVNVTRPRAARVDTETTDAQLQRGENQLLVEVTDRGGAWALYLRITDAAGAPLSLTDDGQLVAAPGSPQARN